MSSASSTVTYISVYTDFEPGRVFWEVDEELSDGGSPRVIVYGYDGLLMQPIALPSPDYVPGPEEPELAPLSPEFDPEPELPDDDMIIAKDQPYANYALPIALSPGYVADSDPEEDLEEDPEEDHIDYPADGGDDDDEPSDDDDDDDDDDIGDENEEPFEDEEDDEEEEHLALADSPAVPVIDLVPSAEDTEAFEIEEAALTPTSCLPIPPPSPLTLLSSPLPHIPSPPVPPPPSSLHLPPPVPTSLPLSLSPLPPLPTLLFIPPPVDHREDTPEAELPPRKRICLTAPASRYEVGESLTAAPKPIGGHRVDYGFIGTMDAEIRRQRAEEVGYDIRDVWVDPAEAIKETTPTTLKGVNDRVTELAAMQE
ncbi:hypothetical protein Tco_1444886 [Tanacetum coccineum]